MHNNKFSINLFCAKPDFISKKHPSKSEENQEKAKIKKEIL